MTDSKKITLELFKNMFLAGSNKIEDNVQAINDLNVFPVPDGDTGTNLMLTMQSVKEEISKIKEKNMSSLCEAIKQGSLMGARGNSGVILSQIFRGMCDVLSRDDEIDIKTFVSSLRVGREVAYKAVMKPVEGTMLTVISDIASTAELYSYTDGDIENLMLTLIQAAKVSLDNTPNLLDVLREAGVVDAGGLGLVNLFEGFYEGITGKVQDLTAPSRVATGIGRLSEETMALELKYMYCTEFMVKGNGINIAQIKEHVESLGDSLLVVGDERTAKIHVHTNEPDKVLRLAMNYGTLHEIQINNMVEQTAQRQSRLETAKAKEIGIVVVSYGEGLKRIFESFGVDFVINGGQTMNPSAKEIVEAVESLNSPRVIVLPNNKNIILTANQVKQLSSKEVFVIPSKTIPQGISAIMNYSESLSLKENLDFMSEAIGRIKTGEITTATRDAKIKNVNIKKGEIIAIADDELCAHGSDVVEVSLSLVDKLNEGGGEVMTIYWGEDSSKDDLDRIIEEVRKNYTSYDVEVYEGGQPLYPYIFSLE